MAKRRRGGAHRRKRRGRGQVVDPTAGIVIPSEKEWALIRPPAKVRVAKPKVVRVRDNRPVPALTAAVRGAIPSAAEWGEYEQANRGNLIAKRIKKRRSKKKRNPCVNGKRKIEYYKIC
jgi:hypothetical protein